MLLLTPLIIQSNWFYAYEFGGINGLLFDAPTRGLAIISAVNVGQWLYAIIYQFSTGYDKGRAPDPPINFTDGGAYVAPMILFMYCGLADSLVQTYAYWIIGAISNSPRTLSRYVGYYKGVQSFGACLACIFIPPTYMVAKCVEDKGSDADLTTNGEKDRYTQCMTRMEIVMEEQQSQGGTVS